MKQSFSHIRLRTLFFVAVGITLVGSTIVMLQWGFLPLTASAESQKSFPLAMGESRSLYLPSLPAQLSVTLTATSFPNEGIPWKVSLFRNTHGKKEGYSVWYTNGKEPSWWVGKQYPEGAIEENFFTHTVVTNPIEPGVSHTFSAIIYPSNSKQALVHLTMDGQVIGSFIDAVDVGARFSLDITALTEDVDVTHLSLHTLEKPKEPQRDRVLFFGDSITYGPATHRDTESMPARVQEFFNNDISVINAGYPAELTDDSFIDRHHEGLTRFIALLEVLRPEHVVIFEGTNNPTDPELAQDIETMVKASLNLKVQPLLATLPPLYDGRSVNAANTAYRRIADRYAIPLLDFEKEFLEKQLFTQDVRPGTIVTTQRQLIAADGVHPAPGSYFKLARIAERSLRVALSQHYLAEWVGQEVVNGERDSEGSILIPRGKTAEISVRFRNRGTRPWFAEGEDKVGIYVYRDELWSTPREYNNPLSPLFGSDPFADQSWGPNATNSREFARPALVTPAVVSPGEIGTFVFRLHAPLDAPIHEHVDSLTTETDDRYDRSDFSLAAGQAWMKNPFNGDPFGIAHVWFWIKVV